MGSYPECDRIFGSMPDLYHLDFSDIPIEYYCLKVIKTSAGVLGEIRAISAKLILGAQ